MGDGWCHGSYKPRLPVRGIDSSYDSANLKLSELYNIPAWFLRKIGVISGRVSLEVKSNLQGAQAKMGKCFEVRFLHYNN